MLQEASKIISSAFQDSFVKRLCLYLHDCVREEVRSSAFRNLNQDKENRWFFIDGDESILTSPESSLNLDGTDSTLTEIMVQAEVSQKDRYLIYGHLFLTGRNPKRKRSEEFLTPILYTPCKLERTGLIIKCSLSEETISLNTGALSELLKSDDEDEVEHLLEGLIDAVPELPLNKEKLEIFTATLRAIIPDIEVVTREEVHTKQGLCVSPLSAIILTKRPTMTAGLLHELTQMAEKPVGVYRETCLSVIQDEFNAKPAKKSYLDQENPKGKKQEEFYPITPLSLSDSQREVIKSSFIHPLTAVYGPPGTGKSQTIVNLVSHLVASGKTVLVASRMDKAVDVVSERLNGLGAPFLCLRAGRANYQKQLNFELQDLLSNKTDLDTGFESAVLTDIEDIKSLFKSIKETEDKCRNILELEKEWFKNQNNDDISATQFISENQEYIKERLTHSEIESYRNLLERIEQLLDKSGFFNGLLTKFYFYRINKKLKDKKLKPFRDEIDALRLNLTAKEITNKLKEVESSINRVGNLHQLLESLRELRKKQKQLSINILKNKRRESLKSLIRDQVKRQRLIVHSKALIERKKNLQSRLLDNEDFSPLLEAFPCWAVTTYAISECLPLKPGLFDVAIIDEASQCDIASCFPVMFRAKRTLVVGDDKQLPHMSFLEKAKEQSFLSQYNIPDKYQLMWRFRTNSVFDLANYYASNSILLDEHFRSCPQIINFSNKEFYGNRIRVMNRDLSNQKCLELFVVPDAKVDLDTTRNMAEVEEILKKVQEIILSEEDSPNPTSIGIISPFRGQVELIKKSITQIVSDTVARRHSLEIGTAHTFQGDEKDIIFLSFTLGENSHHQSLTFAQKPNLFNVAITRAKKKLYCYISKPVESVQSGLLKSYLEYIREINENSSKEREEKYNNSFEQEIASLCKDEGLTVYPNFDSAGLKINLVVSDGENSVAIECDGFDDGREQTGNTTDPVWKQEILERCGWKVLRITAREWHYSKNACIGKIKENLSY